MVPLLLKARWPAAACTTHCARPACSSLRCTAALGSEGESGAAAATVGAQRSVMQAIYMSIQPPTATAEQSTALRFATQANMPLDWV